MDIYNTNEWFRNVSIAFLIFGLSFFTACKRTTTNVPQVHCAGLLNDSITANDSARIFMPNAFTPNGDGINDVFVPVAVHISTIDFTVYDAGMHEVFNSKVLNEGWKPSISSGPAFIFYYKVQAVTTSHKHIGLCGEFYRLSCLPAWLSASRLRFSDQIDPRYGFVLPTSERKLHPCF